MLERIKHQVKSFLSQFFLLHGSPQSIATGFGLGVFLGILPFTGVVAAIALACFFRLNRSAAILGSVLTNTWLSVVVFAVSVKISCALLHLDSQYIQTKFSKLIKSFTWNDFYDLSFWQLLATVALGYLIVSFLISLVAYGLMLLVLSIKRRAQ